jgi:hypothetical protein
MDIEGGGCALTNQAASYDVCGESSLLPLASLSSPPRPAGS